MVHGVARSGLAVPLLAVANSENWVSTLGAHFYCDIALLLLLARGEKGRRYPAALEYRGVHRASRDQPDQLAAGSSRTGPGLSRRSASSCVLDCSRRGRGFTCELEYFRFSGASREPAELTAAPHLLLVKLVLWPLAGHRIADAYAEFALQRAVFSTMCCRRFGSAGSRALFRDLERAAAAIAPPWRCS